MKPSRSWFSWKILLSLLVEENGEILRKLLSMCEISSGQLTIHASLLRPTKIRRLMVGFIKGYSFQISGTRASLNILRCMLKTTWLIQYLLDISEEQKLHAIHRLAYCFFFFLAVLFFDLTILYCVCFFAILILRVMDGAIMFFYSPLLFASVIADSVFNQFHVLKFLSKSTFNCLFPTAFAVTCFCCCFINNVYFPL